MYGVICGFYRNGELHPRETEKMLDRTTRSKVLDELVTEPSLCYLLHKSLDEKTIALLSNAYNVITAYLINILVACIYMQEITKPKNNSA